ncbi:MAG: PSD1 and planctomycete cytochrome C domain-containing protein [Bacteroidota bacterium]
MQNRAPRMKLPLTVLLLFAVVASGAFLFGKSGEPELPEIVDYNEHIKPLLSANCYVCHGPDISSREAGLRLDLRDSAMVELEGGVRALVPGNSNESALIQRVVAHDPEERMPPPELKKVLSDHEVGLLRKWIDQGAAYKPHWALVPPEKQRPPRVRRSWEVENEIDRFVLASLEDKRLAPAPKASKETLIRRLSFVLTGLPPSPEGVQAFLEDESPDAYDRLVDRLLDSPHFGERWARHWMDLVRYANTRGHEFDYPVIGANTYRDYLIRAFNTDLPYDELVKEHLAGDLLEKPRVHPVDGFNESAIGTVFYGLGEGKHSPVDTRIEESDRNDIIIDVTSKTFQGLTVSCAKCHDHKFDPIPTTDYYALYGMIRSSRYAVRANVTPEVIDQATALSTLHDAVRRTVADVWREQPLADAIAVEAVKEVLTVPDTPAFEVLGDFTAGTYDMWRPQGLAFESKPVAGMPVFEAGALSGLAPPSVSSATRSSRLFGALRSPDFELNHNYITVRAAGHQASIRVIMDNFQLIQYPIYGGLEAAVDTTVLQDYVFDVKMWKGKKVYLEMLPGSYKRQHFEKADTAYIEAVYAVAHDEESPALHALINTTEVVSSEHIRATISNWEAGSADEDNVALLNGLLQQGTLPRVHADTTPLLADLRADIAAAKTALPASNIYMGVIDGDGADHPVFIRGAVASPSETLVARRSLTLLDSLQTPYDTDGSGRLHFAESLLAPDNPLTSRVMVNRLWHYVFGKGIVETVDNFGVQGKYPSHPALLDNLAIQFMQEGWSIKQMLRHMVRSNTFQRATVASSKSQEIDPENIYLQHYPVRRIEAEAIRDAMLVASGRFNPEMFGEDIPVHLTEFMEGRGRPAASGPLDGDGRRSIYLSVRRNFLQPFMLVFDMPIPFTSFGKRNTSNVPAQSLTLLNDPFVYDQAGHWAREIIALKDLDTAQRIRLIYQRAFARVPTPEEVENALAFLQAQARTYALDAGMIDAESTLNDERLWQDFCHTIFNMKEFIHLV